MRSALWTALALPLLALLSSPAAAREFPVARILQQRMAYSAPGAAPVELHVAAGTATTVRIEAFPELLSLELTEGRATLQLLPTGGASFIISPPGDFAVGERALVTVKLGPPELAVSLLLVSRKDVVDSEVRLALLRAPTLDELDVDSVARVLNATPRGRVSLAVEGPMLQGPKIRIQVESILRLDSRVFVTLVGCPVGKSRAPWKLERARLRVLLEGGSQVEVPLLLVSNPSKRAQQQRYTLVAPLPERSQRLFLKVEGEGAPEGFFPLPWSEERPSP
jgi:hypothetical protein